MAKLSQEEIDRRFDELLPLIDMGAYPDVEAFEKIGQKWAEHGRPITLTMVKRYYHLLKRRYERGDDLYELAKSYGWSEIVWPRQGTF